MAYFKNLITGNINGDQKLPMSAIEAQRLASCMAWQILMDYPIRQVPNTWKIYNNLRGVMLADEVGGGKTFETLAIISKALLAKKSKKDRFRVLIIANPSIRLKWEWRTVEDRENKLELNYEQFDIENCPNTDIQKFIKQTKIDKPSTKKLFDFFSKQISVSGKKNWIDLNKYRQGIWLTSFQSIPVTEGSGNDAKFKKGKLVFPENFFDWIIVDEAHSLKGNFNDQEESIKWNGSAVSKIYAVLNCNLNSKLLLLTATPFQNNKSELKQLLCMLEKTDPKGNSTNITDIISKGIDVLEKEISNLSGDNISVEKVKNLKKCFDNDINKLIGNTDEELQRPQIQNIVGNKISTKNGLDKKVHDRNGLDDFLRDVMIRNTKESLEIIPVVANLNEKEKFQYLLLRDLVKTTEEKSQMFSTKLSQLVSSRDSFSKNISYPDQNTAIEKLFGGNLVFEAKYKKLLSTLNEIVTTKEKNVITIFVSWKGTVETLEERLKKSKYKVLKPLTGDIKTTERAALLEQIEEENVNAKSKLILLASRVGNEGLDFDKFSNRVIHYDNNFNPAIIDQRNGRVYRGSNIKPKGKKVTHNDIEIYQLFLEESYDQRILFIEQEKRKMKNFYLGDSSLHEVLIKTMQKNKLPEEKAILDIVASIKIDLTPSTKYILLKYKNELVEKKPIHQ